MARTETYGTRDLAFSAWHRQLERDDLTWIDIDHCAYCDCCKAPLYLMELAQDIGQRFKPTTITRRVAEQLGVPALLVFYKAENGVIQRFRVRRIAPTQGRLWVIEPSVLAKWIEQRHDDHVCATAEKAA